MGPDAAHLAGAVARSLEPERIPSASQRASEVSQDQLAQQSMAALGRKRPDAADQVYKEKVKRERERRRRELERRLRGSDPDDDADTDTNDGPMLDVVA